MSQLHPHRTVKSDVVKKGVLKYKASKVKGTSGASAGGPKSSKSLFMVFRALHTGEKFLHLYLNEKRFHEAEDPKWDVSLEETTSIKLLCDKKCFCISMSSGGLIFLDSSTVADAEEWVKCLNAVLFAKGLTGESILRYEVDMQPNSMLSHHGASILELSNCDLIIWDSEVTEEIVHWKLNHLRSFKAKKQTLTIVAGSRSCTGFGEFVFKAWQSVQITHAIETIVARIKNKCSPTPSLKENNHCKKRPHQSEPLLPGNIPDVRDPMQFGTENCASSSIIANIPNFTPSGLYDMPDDLESPPQNYKELGHNGCLRLPPPSILGVGMASTATNYEQLDRQVQIRSSRGSSPILGCHNYNVLEKPDAMSQRSHSKSSKLQARAKLGYEDIDSSMIAEAGKRCDTTSSKPPIANRLMTAPQVCTSSTAHLTPATFPDEGNMYSAISEESQKQVSYHKALHLPQKPLRPQSECNNVDHELQLQANYMYDALSEANLMRVSAHKAPVPPQMFHMHMPQLEDYGKLDHTQPSSSDDLYDAISEESQMQVVHPEVYNKLTHRLSQLPSPTAEEYGELDHGHEAWEGSKGGAVMKSKHRITLGCRKKISEGVNGRPDSSMKVEGYEMLQGKEKSRTRHTVQGHQISRKWIPQPELEPYGKLEFNTKSGKKSDRDKPKPNTKSAQSYHEGTHSNFDPYGTLTSRSKHISDSSIDSQSINDQPGDMIEEEYSTPIPVYSVVDKTMPTRSLSVSKPAIDSNPPPGYEKLTPLCPSTAQLASSGSVVPTELIPPSAPPRRASINKKRYENIIMESPMSEVRLPLDRNDMINHEPSKMAVLTSPVSSESANSSPVSESKPMLAPKPKIMPKPKIV